MDDIKPEIIEAMAAAAWNRHANVRWDQFFVGDRVASKAFYLQAMRAAAEVYRLHQSTAIIETMAGFINDLGM